MMPLKNEYQRDDFLKFLEEDFLSDFRKDIKPVNSSGLSSIQKAHYLGESKNLDLQVFEFLFEGSPNKRIALTKDAFTVMRSSAIFKALAVFHSPNSKDWRFSLMTATPEPTEKGKVSLSYSNPKRLSFFLGPNARVNTPTKYLLNKGKIIDFNDLKNRFSIEVVNKEFYKEISQAFTKLVGGLLKLPSSQDKSRANLEFAVRLIGRIIFCWFLREKKSQSGLALMPQEILSLEAVKKNDDYYHKILEPIFFEILNKPIKSRIDVFSKEPFLSVPYLNGGLFSPQDDDYYKRTNDDYQSQYHNTLIIPDEWFKDFFEILETYNFTIDENTSYDEELSIDPEMLGRIFENLLAEINPETGESARKSTGSYYTPRIIVNYMVDESLMLYLKAQTGIKEEKLKAIISYDLDDDVESPITADDKEKIIDALEKVKILDPACGSGAFPMGALQKIVFILQQTDPDGQLWFKKQIKNTSPEIRRVVQREFEHKNFDYIRKLGIIRENIYGVDIQPIATEISRLRCFLTLVVDERIQDELENRGIEPLPNLDFKFVTANTLIGLPGSQGINQMSLFEDDAGIRELKELRDLFFNAYGTDRDQLKLQFVHAQDRMFQRLINEGIRGHADLTTKLTTWDPFSHKSASWFDQEWMFGIKDGFDMVIANPPYKVLTRNNIPTIEHDYYIKNYKAIKSAYSKNLFTLFIEISIKLLNLKGSLSYIVPEGLFKTRSYMACVDLMESEGHTKSVVTFTDYVFENAVTGNLIFLFQKGWRGETSYFHFNNKYELNKVEIKLNKIISKIANKSVILNRITTMFKGMVVKDRDAVLSEDKENNKDVFLLGKNISKWKMLPKYFTNYDSLHIIGGTKKLVKHNQVPRILIRRTGNALCCAYLEKPALTESTLYSCWSNSQNYSNKFLIGLLNSKLLNYYNKVLFITNQQGFPQILMTDLEQLPIKQIAITEQMPFVEIVENILKITSSDDYPQNITKQAQVKVYEKLIDQMVYKLYGLTDKEIEIIECSNDKN